MKDYEPALFHPHHYYESADAAQRESLGFTLRAEIKNRLSGRSCLIHTCSHCIPQILVEETKSVVNKKLLMERTKGRMKGAPKDESSI